jgi:hypothetical protein
MDNSRTKKAKVTYTYKGFDGYAPMFGYIGTEGYLLDCELREGKQHCQNGTPDYLKRSLKSLRKLGILDKVLLRLDSGNDSSENIKLLHNQCNFIIKRNLRKEIKEQWLDIAMSIGERTEPRPGKIVYTGKQYNKQPADSKCPSIPVTFKVTVRNITSKGEKLLMPDLEVDTYWTTLGEDATTIIDLYHDHGTSEQFHSEIKSDMDVERFPSGNFETNYLILLLAMLSYNFLRTIGQEMLEVKDLAPVKLTVKRRRIKSVIRDLIIIACKYVQRSNSNFLRFGCNCPWLKSTRYYMNDLQPKYGQKQKKSPQHKTTMSINW